MTQTNNPPIPDSNHDGILDGQDILKKIAEEDAQAPNDDHTAHNLMLASPVQEMAAVYALSGRDPSILKDCTETLTRFTKQTINGGNRLSKDDYLKKLQSEMDNIPNLSQEDKAKNLKQGAALYDVFSTFKSTFPNGVQLSESDTKEILEYFEPKIQSIEFIIISPDSPAPFDSPQTPKAPSKPNDGAGQNGRPTPSKPPVMII